MNVQDIFGPGFRGLEEREQLRTAARELEAVFLTQLLGAMRKTVPEGGLFGQTASEDMFQGMLDTELAGEMARRSPFGLADALTRDLEKDVKRPEETTETANKSFRRVG